MDEYGIFVWAVYGATFVLLGVLGVASYLLARRTSDEVAALKAMRAAERDAITVKGEVS